MLKQHDPGQGVVRLILCEGFILLLAPLPHLEGTSGHQALTPTASQTTSAVPSQFLRS